MSKRIYHPSETQLALHPPSTIIECKCRVRFQARPSTPDSDDDPTLCLTCNRKSWSRLWNNNKPVEPVSETVSAAVDVVAVEQPSDLVFSTDVGEVVPIKRGRR